MKYRPYVVVSAVDKVTIHARVWIEIHDISRHVACMLMSPSTRGCGLKSKALFRDIYPDGVTLHARVWIEMHRKLVSQYVTIGHPPREGVD